MPARDIKSDNELSLSEMLADPIIQAVMVRDGISRNEVEGLIHAVWGKRARARILTGRMGRQVTAETAFTERQTLPGLPTRRNGG